MKVKANNKVTEVVESIRLVNGGSLNAILPSGFYMFSGEMSGLPLDNGAWFTGVIITLNGASLQILLPLDGSILYTRRVDTSNGVINPWGWRKIAIPAMVGGYLKTYFLNKILCIVRHSHAEGEGKNAVRNRRSGWNRGDAFGGFKRDKNAWNLLLLKLRNRHLPERTSELLKFHSADTHCASGEINRDRAGYPVPNHSDKRHEWKLQTRLDRLARLAGLEGHVKGLIGGGARV